MTRRHGVLLVAAVIALAMLGCSNTSGASGGGKPGELKSLTVDEVAARVAAKDARTFIFDNNPKERFAKGHVPGAKWLDEDNVTAATMPADKTATLIFYCHNES